VRFVAQALCVYEATSIERAFRRLKAPGLGDRAARARAAGQLTDSGRRRRDTDWLDMDPALNGEQKAAGGTSGVTALRVLWPALGVRQAGFKGRALALGVSEVVLVGYAIAALSIGRTSGWIYLAVAGLIHIEAVFALGDFHAAEVHAASAPPAGEKGT
jgi:hypothetical protein